MIKELRFFVFSCILSASAVSCHEMVFTEDLMEEGVTVPLELSCELLETEIREQASRSMHDQSDLRRISNANYYVFRSGVLVKQGYFADADDFAVTLPSREAGYNLYILANVGEKIIDSDTMEPDMDTAVHHDYESAGNYFSTIREQGFPMSVKVNDFSAESSRDILLKRLVHTVYVSVDTDALKATSMDFTGLCVRNAARDVFPFAEKSKALYVMDGDEADYFAAELQDLNYGDKVELYLLENMRGELFPGNTDWKEKVPANMSPYSEWPYCSYIELTAAVQTSTALYENNIYRAFLGTSAADCDVRRHTYFDLCNRFVNDAVVDEEWRIEADTPVVNEKLMFVKGHGNLKEVTEATTYPGFVKEVYIYRSNPDIEFTIKDMDPYSAGPWYQLEDVDEHYTRLKLCSYCNWDFIPGSKKIVLQSGDGLITKTLTAKLETSYGLKITPETTTVTNSDSYSTEDVILNIESIFAYPIKLHVSVNGILHGYLETYPDGTENGAVIRRYEEPISHEYSGIFNGSMDFSFNMYTHFNNIHKITEYTSENKYNDNKTYLKNAAPTILRMDYEIEFSEWDGGDKTFYPIDKSTYIPLTVNCMEYEYAFPSENSMGAGTDWGIQYWHTDNYQSKGLTYLVKYNSRLSRWEPHDDSIDIHLQPIMVTVNGTDTWTSHPPEVTYKAE